MKKRIAILVCLFATALPVVPIWGEDSAELIAGISRQSDELLSEAITYEERESRVTCSSDVEVQSQSNIDIVTHDSYISIITDVPYNRIKSYMSYKNITSRSSDQYKLQQMAYTGIYGIRQVNGRFCVAVGSAYTTQIGQYIDLVLEDGTIIPCILGDCKADEHTDSRNILTSDGSLAEFVVDVPSLSKTVRYTGDISTACDDWESMITRIIIYDKVEGF